MFMRPALRCAPLLVACALMPASAEAALSAGAGRATIETPPDMLPVQGFGTLLDPIAARVVLFDDGATKAALAVVDLTSIGDDGVAAIKRIVADAVGALPANVLIDASHTFSSPHMPMPGGPAPGANAPPGQAERNARYVASVYDAVKRAASAAAAGLRPVRIGVGAGSANVNVNRNMLTADGWWLGADENGPSDKSVGVVRIDDTAGKPVAVLVNYAVQSAVMDQAKAKDGSKLITADLGGAAVKYIEDQYGGDAVAMFLVGAAGDQFPTYKAQRYVLDKDGHTSLVDIGDAAYPLVTLQGERLGTEAVRVRARTAATLGSGKVRVVNDAVELAQQERARNLQQIRPTKAYTYTVTGKARAPYAILQVGDLAIVGVAVELSAVTGRYIREHSPFRNTLVVTMVNGAAKYLPDASGYRDFTYEAQNSSYGPGSGEQMAEAILKSLRAAHGGR